MTNRKQMVQVKIIAVGSIKEDYYREAIAEYVKRLSAYCRTEICEIKESKLPDDPSSGEIAAALSEEAGKIAAQIPPKAYTVALCVEGKQYSSPELAALLGDNLQTHPSLCFIIGSSFGLDPQIKKAADLRLSFSGLTFPHRLFRVMLMETVYRSFSIMKGTKYHK